MHQGGLRFNRESIEYQILRDWIAEGAPGPTRKTPALTRLEVSPRESVLIEPVDSAQLQVTAHFADGTSRDVTSLASYEATNRNVAVEHDGLVRREKLGQATVLVRFLSRQLAVRLAFLPDQPGYKWNAPATVNYIDELNFKVAAEAANESVADQ